uniref:hypothetical protein n=1 Tax=Bordetella sputigena TaxID=1416810 RepID=UPI0039EEFAF4
MRVPILRPRLAAWLDGAMLASAVAAALLALSWQGVLSLPLLAAAALLVAVLAIVTSARAVPRRSGIRGRRPTRPRRLVAPHGPVSAVRMERDGTFYLRLRNGWHPAEWVSAWRGPRWLTLRARVQAAAGDAAASPRRCVTFTVWQDALPAPAWRRTCMLTARRLCRTPSRRVVGAP